VFHQTKDESIIINGEIIVTVLEINGDEVVLGIDAPQWLAIEERPEFHAEIAGNFASMRRG
jgi:carbon storage regulator CsrA